MISYSTSDSMKSSSSFVPVPVLEILYVHPNKFGRCPSLTLEIISEILHFECFPVPKKGTRPDHGYPPGFQSISVSAKQLVAVPSLSGVPSPSSPVLPHPIDVVFSAQSVVQNG